MASSLSKRCAPSPLPSLAPQKRQAVFILTLSCRYGVVRNDGEGCTHGVAGSSVDVAMALQYLVDASRLQLHNSRKDGLPGFYDVAPVEDKVLYVLYRFKGLLHEVFVDDDAPLLLPLKSHCLPDALQRKL